MNLSCTTDKYDELYARWLPDAEKLLDFGKFQPHDRVLDLCGGSGAVAKAVLFRASVSPTRGMFSDRVSLLDLNPRCSDNRVNQIEDDAKNIRRHFGPHSLDLVICRQAIGYIEVEDLPLLFEHIAETLTPGGRFVFNNFFTPRWYVKTYRFNGRRYFEAAGHLGNTVYHLQASPGIGVDATCFRWHKHSDLMEMLDKRFIVRGEVNNRSARYRCVVRD